MSDLAPAAPAAPSTPAAAPSAPAAAPSGVPQADGDTRAPAESRAAAKPASEEIEYTGRGSLDKMFERAETDVRLDTLSGKSEVSVDDLRSLPGADKFTDAQLAAMWQEVQGKAAVANAPGATGEQPRGPDGKFLPKSEAPATTAAQQRAWKALNGDTEVTDFSKMTADELLKLTFGYNANGKEQRRTFDELVRNAQLGHHNAEKMQTLEQERNTAYQNWKAKEAEAAELTNFKGTWNGALNAASRGNFAPLQTLLDAYVQALDAPAPQTAPSAHSGVSPEVQQRGLEVYHRVVMPRAQELAAQFGLPADDVAQGIMALVEREPAEFMTQGKLMQIMQHEIVQHIESFMAGKQPAAAAQAAPVADPRDAEIAALKHQLGLKVAADNTRVQELHERRRTAPPPNGTVAGSSGVESPNFEGAAGAREWLRNLR